MKESKYFYGTLNQKNLKESIKSYYGDKVIINKITKCWKSFTNSIGEDIYTYDVSVSIN